MMAQPILIVDDDPFQRAILARLIGFISDTEVYSVASGHEALALLASGATPGLIFCDLQMPDMDGVELIRELGRRRCEAALVLLSAAGTDLLSAVQIMAQAYGFNRITALTKPISQPQLRTLLAAQDAGALPLTAVAAADAPDLDEVANGLQRGQFQPWFQPQIDAASGQIVAAEALVRWLHPRRGVLLPGQFLSLINRLGQRALLTAQMLNGALRAAAHWRSQGHDIGVSVNVDGEELGDLQFVDRVRGLLDTYALPSERLTIELVESSKVTALGATLDTLSRLRLHGVRLSIDDFGTGYNALSQLMASPFTELKIDRRFVSRMMHCHKHRAVVRLCAGFGRDMGVQVVAEGVEDQETATELAIMGCDLLQGFVYSPALSADDFGALLEQRKGHGRHSAAVAPQVAATAAVTAGGSC